MRRRGRAAPLLAVLAILATAAAAPVAAAQDQPGAYIDVTEGVHKPAIDALAAKGLFEGTLCGDGEFCPNEPIKRSTMAVWLVRAIEDTEPPQPQDPRFVDVAAEHPWAGHIERLAQLNITVGCGTQPLRFCPSGSVTRAQMASFLTRAFDFEAAEPAGFTDLDPDGSHNANIDALAAAGITAGCASDPLRYCPQRPVTRAEMATFLVRALNRSQEAPPTGQPADPTSATATPQEPGEAPPDDGDPPPDDDGDGDPPPDDDDGDGDPPPDDDDGDGDPPPDDDDERCWQGDWGTICVLPLDEWERQQADESDLPPPPPSQEPGDAPPDDGDPPDDDDERRSCVDGLCFVPLTEEEWRKAREDIFGE